jgi:hypothetical protein
MIENKFIRSGPLDVRLGGVTNRYLSRGGRLRWSEAKPHGSWGFAFDY